MRLEITTEQFNFNELLKLIEHNLRWTLRVGYQKEGLTPLLVAQYASGYLVRNINMNSMSANIQELSYLLQGQHDKFIPMYPENVILLDDILKNNSDYETIKYNLNQFPGATEVELKTIFPELDKEKKDGKH